MASSTSFLVLFSLLVLCGLCGTTFSNQQEVKKTIKTKHGVYDCVDFYKQPAFNHPLLKNHAYKIPNLEKLQEQKGDDDIKLKDGGCPYKTVPILRTNLNSSVFDINQLKSPDKHCDAIVHTNNLDRKFLGVAGVLSLYKPVVQPNQWSTARIKLLNGDNSFEAGWMVNPAIFKDNEAHLYASFAAGGKGCINLQCSGFVQVAKDMPLGIVPSKYSEYRGQQRAWGLTIVKRQDDGNWWLSFTRTRDKIEKDDIGYWPKELFTSLKEFSNQVEWGGEIFNPELSTPPPEMGNGRRAIYDAQYTAAVFNATYVNESYENVVDPEDTHKVWECEKSYTVKDGGFTSQYLGRVIYYGGPNNPLML